MKSVDGIWLPDYDTHFAKHAKDGNYQAGVYLLAMRHVTSRHCAIDVGAHVGYWSRMMARDFEVVHAFEPHPDNYACLETNAPPWVHMHLMGLGPNKGFGVLDTPAPDNSGAWKLHYTDQDNGHVIIDTLDSVVGMLGRTVGLLKVDVQDGEIGVLMGGKEMLRRDKPVVVVEENNAQPRDFLLGIGAELKQKFGRDVVMAWPR